MLDRIRAHRGAVQERLADRSVATAHGIARLADAIPDVYDANFLSVDGAVAPAAVLAEEADETMADRHHRRVIVEGAGSGLTDDFAALGFTRSTHLVLAHQREPDRLVDASMAREATLDELVPLRTRAILAEPWGDPGVAVQLNEAKRRIAAAVPTRYFAVLACDEIAGYCELRLLDGVAQIEDVEVMEEHRGRGLGRALVQHALDEGLRVADIVFLEALADDWPRELYAKLGFVAVDSVDYYTRLPHALTRLKLRTPRLELRLATVAELRRLYEVATWRDGLDEDAFLALHRDTLAQWSSDQWALNLIAFLDGEPVGLQEIEAEAFARTRTVATGSRLGRACRRQGLETEMRAAALTLAFDGLRAESAGCDDLELRRESFSTPVPVEISGLRR
ncbi:MAG TPA: GNAT family N-acetyltransferase, partial [Gaiellaceae bacterium]|nr:GNAT family N-acetyltransferase [Gaiellaceae bacterium]